MIAQSWFAAAALFALAWLTTIDIGFSDIITDPVWPYILLNIVAAGALLGTLYAVTRTATKDAVKALGIALICGYLLLNYSALLRAGLGAGPALAAYVVLTGAAGVLLLKCPRLRVVAVESAATVIILSCLWQTATIIQLTRDKVYDAAAIPPRPSLLDPDRARGRPLPDIYFMMFDAYPGAGPLKRLFGYDNAPFLDALENRGFFVARDSRSHYIHTMLSVPSTLNLDYFQDDVRLPHTDYYDRGPALRQMWNPRLAAFLRDLGYEIDAYSPLYRFSAAGMDSPVKRFMDEMPRSLIPYQTITATPIQQILTYVLGKEHALLNNYADHREDVQEQFQRIERSLRRGADQKPLFSYTHLLMPHTPFVFRPDGGWYDDDYLAPFGHFDGGAPGYGHLFRGGWTSYYRTGMPTQVQFVNNTIMGLLDKGLARPDSRPRIVIIQSDHGSRMTLDFKALDSSHLYEAFHNFNAVYFSDGDYAGFNMDTSGMNVLRRVAEKYFGQDTPQLESRQFYSTWEQPYKFTDVTDAVTAKETE